MGSRIQCDSASENSKTRRKECQHNRKESDAAADGGAGGCDILASCSN